jgi:hypothetical protein
MLRPLPERLEERVRQISAENLAARGMTRDEVRATMLSRLAEDARSPRVGDDAPDFELERLGSDGKRTGELLRLSGLRGQPVGLIFGSYT